MSFFENLKMAFSAIRMNLLRAVLTMLIIGFGIMSLISMITAVEGMKAALANSFSQAGSNTFNITEQNDLQAFGPRFGSNKNKKPITLRQAQEFQRRYGNTTIVSINFEPTNTAIVKYFEEKTPPKIKVIGTDENYLNTSGFAIAEGRNISAQDVQSAQRTAILGYKLKQDIFGEINPLGASIRINNEPFMVVGWLKEKGSMFGSNQDEMVIIPLLTAQNSFSVSEELYRISVQVPDVNALDIAIDEATGILRAVRRIMLGFDNDFSISRSDMLAEVLQEDLGFLTIIAMAIGLVTLLGAAVGLTNIMLVSVKERTREIGVRKALGAKTKSIRNQFLWEAVVICQAGGWLGIFIGIILGNIVASYFEGPFIIPYFWIIIGFVVCFFVGIISGLGPAIKAANLDPIDALRYE